MNSVLPVSAVTSYGLISKTASQARIALPMHVPQADAVHIRPALLKFAAAPAIDEIQNAQRALGMQYPIRLFSVDDTTGVEKSVADAVPDLRSARRVTLGDLHGSALKLLETAVSAGMVSAPPKVLQNFAHIMASLDALAMRVPCYFNPYDPQSIYSPYEMTTAMQREGRALIQQLKPVIDSLQWTGENRELLLIGDELSDRASFDQPMLMLVDALMRKAAAVNGHVHMLASNHSYNAVRYIAGADAIDCIAPSQARSMLLAWELVAGDERATKELKAAYLHHFQNQELLYFDPEDKVLYTHAALSRDNLEQLIGLVNQPGEYPSESYQYGDLLSEDTLKYFVGDATFKYQTHITQTLKKIRGSEDNSRLNRDWENFLLSEIGFLWKRFETPTHEPAPLTEANSVVLNVHGHDRRQAYESGSLSLDNNCRKLGLENLPEPYRVSEPHKETSPIFISK